MAYYYTLTLDEVLSDLADGWFWVCNGDAQSCELGRE